MQRTILVLPSSKVDNFTPDPLHKVSVRSLSFFFEIDWEDFRMWNWLFNCKLSFDYGLFATRWIVHYQDHELGASLLLAYLTESFDAVSFRVTLLLEACSNRFSDAGQTHEVGLSLPVLALEVVEFEFG